MGKDRFLSFSQGSLPECKQIHGPCFDVYTGQLNWAGVICHRILSLLACEKTGLDNGSHCLWIKKANAYNYEDNREHHNL